MPIRKTVGQHVVVREGKQVVVPPGTKYNFTAAELKDIEAIAPDSLYRKGDDEDADEDGNRVVHAEVETPFSGDVHGDEDPTPVPTPAPVTRVVPPVGGKTAPSKVKGGAKDSDF